MKKLKMTQFFPELHTHPTCHTLSMFGMLRQRVQVPDNSQQLCTTIEEEWDNIP
jgi:hypothetical protein